MAKLELNYEIVPGGIELFLSEEKRSILLKRIRRKIDVSEWDIQKDLHALSGLAKLQALLESAEEHDADRDCTVTILDNAEGYFLPHRVIAALTEGQSLSLGLPPSVPFQLRIQTTGPLLESATQIHYKWMSNGRTVRAEQYGAILEVGTTQYRLADPLYTSVNAVNAFNQAGDCSLDERMEYLASLADLIQHGGEQADLESTLKDLRITHATAFGLSLYSDRNGVNFDPLLFGQEVVEEVEDRGELITDSAHLMTSKQQDKFVKQLFTRYDHSRPTYVLDKGNYLYIDPSLRPALTVVRELQQADPASRKRFAQNPTAFIKARVLGDDLENPELERTLESLFVETTGFSERVKELGLWVPRAIPWLQRETISWIPEKFGIRIGDVVIELDEADIDAAIESVRQAIQEQAEAAQLPSGETIAPNASTLEALQTLKNAILSPERSVPSDEHVVPTAEPDSVDDKPETGHEKHILIVEENVEEVRFSKSFNPRCNYHAPEISPLIKNTPKQHQIEGIGWIQECWSQGYPGALLADDMGLGKTFQTLGFLAWLKGKRSQLGLHKQPVLIVAPTSLLNNWLDEETIHLFVPGLGRPGLLFGKELKSMKLEKSGSDVVTGRSTLEISRLTEFDWLLTTYETLRDYHISLGAIKFSCVVFDEMQKVKNPGSMNTAAAQTLNADFALGLTGTPVENSLSDLWCILDILIPGYLGGLKEFMSKYPEDDHAGLTTLKTELLERSDCAPQPILRRMKSDILRDLPRKNEYVLDELMVSNQAAQYEELIKRVKREEEKKGARLIHKFRMLSLHPDSPESDSANDADKYIADSARLRVMFKQLDLIAERNEKVLIFLESLAMQEWLAFVIKQRYGLKAVPPRIYGDIASEVRKRIVDRFQERKDIFGVMILSPKAGGVGLTITAATNVIHLSRWWNPAVEDQCTDRAYRIGQDREVSVFIPRAIHPVYQNGSFDVILHDLLERKRSLSKTMLLPMEGKGDADFVFSRIA